MKKYITIALLCFSFSSFSVSTSEVSGLGQVEQGEAADYCNSKVMSGCGACFKKCMGHYGSSRDTDDKINSASSSKKVKAGAAGKQ